MNDQPHPYRQQLDILEKKIKRSEELLQDPEMKELAQEEIKNLKTQQSQLKKLSEDYQKSLEEQEKTLKDPTRNSSAILEFRGGAGGDEAKIWAEDLLRMYLRYAESKGLKVNYIDDLSIKIRGKTSLEIEVLDEQIEEKVKTKLQAYPFQLLRYEAGVHRVQRVPTTETQGRIHTSTASVAVLPEIKRGGVEIRDEDLEWEFMRSGGAGGQSVNKTSSAVRLTHKPTQTVVRVSRERKQLQNREIALELLRAQLWEKEEEKRAAKIDSARSAIGRSMRSEKIRTYNYPQNRVTDHRINQSWHQLESIIEGDLDPIISTVKSELQNQEEES